MLGKLVRSPAEEGGVGAVRFTCGLDSCAVVYKSPCHVPSRRCHYGSCPPLPAQVLQAARSCVTRASPWRRSDHMTCKLRLPWIFGAATSCSACRNASRRLAPGSSAKSQSRRGVSEIRMVKAPSEWLECLVLSESTLLACSTTQ